MFKTIVSWYFSCLIWITAFLHMKSLGNIKDFLNLVQTIIQVLKYNEIVNLIKILVVLHSVKLATTTFLPPSLSLSCNNWHQRLIKRRSTLCWKHLIWFHYRAYLCCLFIRVWRAKYIWSSESNQRTCSVNNYRAYMAYIYMLSGLAWSGWKQQKQTNNIARRRGEKAEQKLKLLRSNMYGIPIEIYTILWNKRYIDRYKGSDKWVELCWSFSHLIVER